MKPKPAHLGPEYAAQWRDPAMVRAYHYRPDYPPPVLKILLGLIRDDTPHVLEIGAGTGDLTLLLEVRIEAIDAVEPSMEMLAVARRRAWGRGHGIRWINAPFETAELNPPYSLAVAGQSLHWTEWEIALPKIARSLSPGGRLAIVDRKFEPRPWDEELRKLCARFSTNRESRPFNLVRELSKRGLFKREGSKLTPYREFFMTIDDYVEALHSGNGFSRDRMEPGEARAFDRAVAKLVEPYARRDMYEGELSGAVRGSVVWGLPLDPG